MHRGVAAHTKLWYLERFRLLQCLSQAQRRHVERMTRMVEVKRGEPIYLPGDPSDQVFLLKTGAVKIVGRSPDGRDAILAILQPGDLFGELADVDEAPRDHRAEAVNDSVLCGMPRSVLIDLMKQSPDLGYQITKLIGFSVRKLRTRVEELLCRSASARLAHTLLDLSRRYGVPDADGVLIPLRLSQADLGKLVGVSRETVNGILQRWKEQGLVEMNRRTIRIKVPTELGRVG